METQRSSQGLTYYLDDAAKEYASTYPIDKLYRVSGLSPEATNTAMVWLCAAASTGTYWGFTAAGYVQLNRHFHAESDGVEDFGEPAQIPVLVEEGYLRERLAEDGHVVYFVTEKLLQAASPPRIIVDEDHH